MTMTSASPRPTQHDDKVIRLAAETSLPDLKKWLGSEAGLYKDCGLLADLIGAVVWDDDGFGRAQYFEEKGYSPDSGLVEILDNIDLWEAERELVAEWVKASNLAAPYLIGTIVEIDKTTGEITAHDERLAKSTVMVESYGHVRNGIGTHGILIAWEKLKTRDGR